MNWEHEGAGLITILLVAMGVFSLALMITLAVVMK